MVIYYLQPQFVNKLLPFIEESCSSLHTVVVEEVVGNTSKPNLSFRII